MALALLALTVGPASAMEAPRIAVLPPENLTGRPVPLDEIHDQLVSALTERGVDVLPAPALEEFMARHRLRYTGGLSRELALAFADETDARAVLVTSIDLYDDRLPPKFGAVVRLVSADDEARIRWMDDVQAAGHEHRGLLGRLEIRELSVLLGEALDEIAELLAENLSSERTPRRRSGRVRFKPRKLYSAPLAPSSRQRPPRVAVVPFSNEGGSGQAGDIVALHFVRHLSRLGTVEVLEPGLVRQALLRGRIVREGGLSLPQTTLLRTLLDVDLILSGTVKDYHDSLGSTAVPRVSFTARGIDANSEQVVWTSMSYNDGDDGVFFFDAGTVHTAHRLASEMARAVVRAVDRRWRRSS